MARIAIYDEPRQFTCLGKAEILAGNVFKIPRLPDPVVGGFVLYHDGTPLPVRYL